MSNDPQAPFPAPESGAGSADAPSAPEYAASQPPAPDHGALPPAPEDGSQTTAPQYAAPQESAPSYPAPQYGTPSAPPPAQAAGGYPPPPPTGGYAPAPGTGPGSVVGQPADLLTRFLARLIDYAILAVVLGVVGVVLVAILFAAAAGGIYSGFGSKLVFGLLFSAVPLAYFTFMESSGGQTIGKMAMRIRTEGPGGALPTMEQALRRNAWMAIWIVSVVPVLGFFAGLFLLAAEIYIAVTISNNVATRQGWHDQFAGGTKVIRVG